MSALEKVSNIPACSFDAQFQNLTYGQRNIIQLLMDKLTNNQPVTRQDIYDCYVKSLPDKVVFKHSHFDEVERRFKYKAVPVRELGDNDWEVKRSSIQWFKLNLGSCIIKGKILAIPIIEAA